MTSVRDTIRRLDAEYARGLLSAEELEARKAALFDTIPEVQEVAPILDDPPPFWSLALIVFAAMVALTALAALLLGDTALAVTLCITLVAAGAVHACRKLDP